MIKSSNLHKLKVACLEAIQYVGMANYAEREQHAKREVARNFEAYQDREYKEIEFREPKR